MTTTDSGSTPPRAWLQQDLYMFIFKSTNMNDRIYVPASDEVISKIIKSSKKEKRSMAQMAALLLEKGLELYETGIEIVKTEA